MATPSKLIRIGTRGSKLALWQAHFVQGQLREVGIETELKIIKTQGDRIQHLSFDKMEGKGFFTKEIEEALLREEIDLAVHSMKDLPTTSPEGLCITAVSDRANPGDTLLIRRECIAPKTFRLAEGAVVGTSSARRKAQMLSYRPDVVIKDIRGNVPTRIQKLRDGNFDAILLAAAGLERIQPDLSDLEVLHLNTQEFVPAPAQGVLAFQTREQDLETRRILRQIHHRDTARRTNVERRVLQLLDGGCHVPLGVFCKQDANGHYHVWAAYAPDWKSPVKRVQLSSTTHDGLAEEVFDQLMTPAD
jgi:hydroxymethylbilane synthase